MKCPKCGYCDGVKSRSIQQNRAYFGLAVSKIAAQCNCTKEDMHKALAGEFLGFNEVKMGNHKVLVPRSTKDLTTKEFMAYVERVQRWAAEQGIDVLNPNEPPLEDPQ